MTNDTKLDPNSFDQAYAILKRNADFLNQSQEPSIDRLLPLVEESMRAYDICKTRLEAIRQALEKQLPEMNRAEVSAPSSATEPAPWEEQSPTRTSKAAPWDADDIPF